MREPFERGLILLVWQTGQRINWNMDFASLRPFVAHVLLVENGSGKPLLGPLRRSFPGVDVDHLPLTRDSPDEHTRELRRMLGGTGQWVLTLEAGSNAFAARRFGIPGGGTPRSAIHLLSKNGDACWKPVLAPNTPHSFLVDASGHVLIDAHLTDTECSDELVVDRCNLTASSTKQLTCDLEWALESSRGNESPGQLFEIAECHYKLGRHTEAAFWYRRCFQEDRDNGMLWRARYQYALCLKAADEPWEIVEAAMAAAFDTNPYRAEPLYHIARHYRDSGDYSKAYEFSVIGLEIDPPKTPQSFNYAVSQYELPLICMSCAVELGKNSDCIRLANKVLRRPGVPEAARKEAADYRSRCMEKLQPVRPLAFHRKNFIVVVTAFRNAGAFLKDCVDSLAAQDYDHCRFVLIDDASTDDAVDGLQVDDARLTIERNETRRGALRNQIDAVNRHCDPDDLVVYVDGDDRLVDASALSYINEFFNATHCWIMYGQYRTSNDRYGHCEPIVGHSPDLLAAIGEMHFPMHIRAHRAGLIGHLQRVDPGLRRLCDDDGGFLDSIADMALMRALMQLAGAEHIRYNDRVLYEYNARNPESHYREFELRRRQDHQGTLLAGRPPLDPVPSYFSDSGAEPGAAPQGSKKGSLPVALHGMNPGKTRQGVRRSSRRTDREASMDHFYHSIPGWFTFQDAYDHILASLPDDEPSTLVEVGSWKGRSTAYIGVEIINSGKPVTLVAVDTFAGSDEELHRQDPDIDHLREVFDLNLAPVRDALGARFQVLQMTSVDASSRFKRGELDAVWLDAAHDLDAVTEDIDAWWPMLKTGGWMGGDDLNWTDVYTAVANRFPVIMMGNLAERPWWLVKRS